MIPIQEIGTSKKKQIIGFIESSISERILKRGDKLPSINSLRNKFSLSRDTILSAYGELKARGIIQSVAGKGYYLIKENVSTLKKVFILFDEFNAFKEVLYNSFIKNIDSSVEVDIFFHHFNYEVFRDTIVNNNGNYAYYIVMPANLENTKLVLDFLPNNKVFLLDQIHDDLKVYRGIYQNFETGIYNCLQELEHQIKNYTKIILAFDDVKQPIEISNGVKRFCMHYKIELEIINNVKDIEIQRNSVYMVLEDSSLISIIKQKRKKKLKFVDDIGLIAFNETPLKEVVEGGITVISTDFDEMGKNLARILANKSQQKVEIPIRLIQRSSV